MQERKGLFLLALDHEREDTFLEVDSTTKPYGEQILRTKQELEDRGWSHHTWCDEPTTTYEPDQKARRKRH
ncbi:MAG: hypothetical protein MJE77_16130 [Proteobacteria bacterium]|nr:hypothetical protein [Pseudomonadota bacterium]